MPSSPGSIPPPEKKRISGLHKLMLNFNNNSSLKFEYMATQP